MNGHGQVADLTRQRLIRHGLAAAVALVERLQLSARVPAVRPAAAAPEQPTPQECGALLARFHALARDCPAELGDLSPATEQVSDALAVIERERLADAVTIARLWAAHARALDHIGRA